MVRFPDGTVAELVFRAVREACEVVPGPPGNKLAARQRVQDAIARGDLVRPGFCEGCRRRCKPDAHHLSYERPLDVYWFCRQCHKRIHAGWSTPRPLQLSQGDLFLRQGSQPEGPQRSAARKSPTR